MFEFGPLAAGQVLSDNGDTIIIVDDSFVLTSQGGYSPDGSEKWGWLPDSGYANPNQNELETSLNSLSWPTSWTEWPGEFGIDSVLSLNEAYYVMDDYSNRSKYVSFGNPDTNYYPFPSDTSKRGLGLRAEVRVYQFGGELKDVLIVKYKLKNESPKDLPKLYFGFHGDPHIGGYTDYADDKIQFIRPGRPIWDSSLYWAKNSIYCWDDDWMGMGGAKTGILGFKFLETPNNNDLTSFHAAAYTNSFSNVPKNIPLMWEWLSATSIDTNQTYFNDPGDYVINFGTGPFSLVAGESKEIALAIFFSNDFKDLIYDAANINFIYYWPNISNNIAYHGGNNNYEIQLTSPNDGIINGETPITWQYSGADPNAKVFIQCSSDLGKTWLPLVADLSVTSAFIWNTNNFKDGVNYVLRIVAYDPNDKRKNYYDVVDNRFKINNLVNAQPELNLDLNFEGAVVNYSPLQIGWLAEDADNSQLNIKIEYSLDSLGTYAEIFNNSLPVGGEIHFWDVTNIPNSPTYYLKITASDGNSDTTIISKSFGINYETTSYVSNYFYHRQGNATPEFLVQIIDTSQVIDDIYELTFSVNNDTTKLMDITNLNSGFIVLNDYLLQRGVSTPVFDGIKILVTDYETNLNYSLSKFNRDELNQTDTIFFPPQVGNPKVRVPNDWVVVFNNLDTSSNGSYLYPSDTVRTNFTNVKVVTPFKIHNMTEKQVATYIAFVTMGTKNLSRWKYSQPIILQPQGATDATTTYQIKFDFSFGIQPHNGDTLKIITYKEITPDDIFQFAVDTTIIVSSVEEEINEFDFALFNNYPNPFTPTTRINWQSPVGRWQTLKVYDVLGREVATLLNEWKEAGRYSIVFDASKLASGVYIYQLRVNDFVASKKFLMIK
ncbi:MAG TPA: hypothetical protein DCE80_10395 [Ignavibacteriales bacterium]|nr:hypothetical protein [Ignavibacteriales bacterium]